MSNSEMKKIGVVVLAAGKGTRLNSVDMPKVMLPIGGRPMVSYVVDTLYQMGFPPERIALVVGFRKETVKSCFGDKVSYAEQEQQLGTAHAAYVGMNSLPPEVEEVLVLQGDDAAFYTAGTLNKFVVAHISAQATVSVLTVEVANPALLGRVIRDAQGRLVAILEKEQINEEQKLITEVNTGTYCINRRWFEQAFEEMPKIGELGEYGLNMVVRLAHDQGLPVQAVKLANPNEWFGVNTPEELKEADHRKRLSVL